MIGPENSAVYNKDALFTHPNKGETFNISFGDAQRPHDTTDEWPQQQQHQISRDGKDKTETSSVGNVKTPRWSPVEREMTTEALAKLLKRYRKFHF